MLPFLILISACLGAIGLVAWNIVEAGREHRTRRQIVVGLSFLALLVPLLWLGLGAAYIDQLVHETEQANSYRMQLLIDAGYEAEVRDALVLYRHQLEAGDSVYKAGSMLHLHLHDRCQELRLDHRGDRLP